MSHQGNDKNEDRYQELYNMYIEKGYPPYIAEDRAVLDVREERKLIAEDRDLYTNISEEN